MVQLTFFLCVLLLLMLKRTPWASFVSGYSAYNLPEDSVYGGHWKWGGKRQQKEHSPLTHHRTPCSGSTMFAGAVRFLHLSGVPALWLSARFSVLPAPISLQCNPLFSRFLRDHNKLLLLLVSGCLPLSSWFPQPALETHLRKSSHVHCLWENTFPIGSLINVRI